MCYCYRPGRDIRSVLCGDGPSYHRVQEPYANWAHETNQGSPTVLSTFSDDVVVDIEADDQVTAVRTKVESSSPRKVVAPPVTFSLMFCSASVMATASTSAFVVLITLVRSSKRLLEETARQAVASSSSRVRIFAMVEDCTAYCALLLRRPRLVAPRVVALRFLAEPLLAQCDASVCLQ